MTSPGGSQEPLQFDAAEPPAGAGNGVTCSVCKRAITTSYHMVNQAVICAECRRQLERELTGGSGTGRFTGALLWGLGGAAAGAAVYYAVLAVTNREIGLIAILVGWLVGRGVQRGSRSRGGLSYQLLAVALTYLAIVSTYVPFIVRGFRERAATEATPAIHADSGVVSAGSDSLLALTLAVPGTPAGDSARATPPVDSAPAPASASASPASPASAVDRTSPSVGRMLLAFAALVALAMAVPFLSGIDNVIGLLIIGIALWQAWKMNRRAIINFTGPFQVGARPG